MGEADQLRHHQGQDPEDDRGRGRRRGRSPTRASPSCWAATAFPWPGAPWPSTARSSASRPPTFASRSTDARRVGARRRRWPHEDRVHRTTDGGAARSVRELAERKLREAGPVLPGITHVHVVLTADKHRLMRGGHRPLAAPGPHRGGGDPGSGGLPDHGHGQAHPAGPAPGRAGCASAREARARRDAALLGAPPGPAAEDEDGGAPRDPQPALRGQAHDRRRGGARRWGGAKTASWSSATRPPSG